jgi:hypothetical protein
LTVDEIAAWLRDGYASRYSRARPEQGAEWRSLQDFEELREILQPSAAATPADREAPDAAASGRRSVNIASSFARAWALVIRHFIELAGWSLSTGLILFLVTQVPRVGWFIGLVVNSVLTGVVSVIYLARIRGRRAVLKDVSAAVWATAVNLCLVGLTQTLLSMWGVVLIAGMAQTRVGTPQTLLAAAGVVLLIAPSLYLAVSYVFAVTLAIDKRLPFWTALELSRRVITRQWWPTFGLILTSLALVAAGILTYGIGLVLAVPLSTAALMYAYEDVFGD